MVRDAEPGTALVKVGEAADSAFFVVRGRAVAGVPSEEGGDRSLSAMGPGDFFGEIGALTGSPRTANVVVDEAIEVVEVPATTLKTLMDEPAMRVLVTSKMSERLTRTSQADLIRLAGIDQRDLKDLRRRRPKSPSLPKPQAEAGSGR
jgi:CRP-like cAMP-binding protein